MPWPPHRGAGGGRNASWPTQAAWPTPSPWAASAFRQWLQAGAALRGRGATCPMSYRSSASPNCMIPLCCAAFVYRTGHPASPQGEEAMARRHPDKINEQTASWDEIKRIGRGGRTGDPPQLDHQNPLHLSTTSGTDPVVRCVCVCKNESKTSRDWAARAV